MLVVVQTNIVSENTYDINYILSSYCKALKLSLTDMLHASFKKNPSEEIGIARGPLSCERQLCQILNAVDILMTIGVYIVRIT